MKYRVHARCESEMVFIVDAENETVASLVVQEALDEDDGADLRSEVYDQGSTTLTGEVTAA
jgi:hypothetical protein